MAQANTFGSAVIGGSTSYTTFVLLRSSTDGTGLTGKVYTDVTASYTRQGAARAAITPATLASASAAWSSGGFILVDDTNCPGLYRLDVPDAAIASGVDEVVISIKVTGAHTSHIRIPLAIEPGLVRRFTASAGAATSLTIPSYNPGADIIKGFILWIESGTGAGQSRQVLTNTSAASTVCTVSTWNTTPDNTSVVRLYGGEYATGTSLADDILARSTKGGSTPSSGTGQTVGEALATKFIESPAGTLNVKHGDDTTAYTRIITRTAGYNAPTSVA